MTREIKEANLATRLVKFLCYLELCIVTALWVQEGREVDDWNLHREYFQQVIESQPQEVRCQAEYMYSYLTGPLYLSPQCRF